MGHSALRDLVIQGGGRAVGRLYVKGKIRFYGTPENFKKNSTFSFSWIFSSFFRQNKISEEHFELLLYKLNYLFFSVQELKTVINRFIVVHHMLRIKAQKYYSQKKSLKEPTFVVARPIDQCGLYPGSPPRLVIQISSVTRLNS